MNSPLHIVCPHCHTTNRVAAEHLGSAPDCGQCHQPLFTGQPLALGAAVGGVPGAVLAALAQPAFALAISGWRRSRALLRRPRALLLELVPVLLFPGPYRQSWWLRGMPFRPGRRWSSSRR